MWLQITLVHLLLLHVREVWSSGVSPLETFEALLVSHLNVCVI